MFFVRGSNEDELNGESKNEPVYMEYYPLGTFNDFFSRRESVMSQMSKVQCLTRLVKSLRYMEEKKVEHMDLKPENVVVDSRMNLRLIDFGQSQSR